METVKYIISVTTAWGSKYGGLNAFNTDFCKALGNILSPGWKLACALLSSTDEEKKDAKDNNVELINIGGEKLHENVAYIIEKKLIKECKKKGLIPEIVWWIGHDFISGEVANYGKNEITGKSAVFQHMASWWYCSMRNYPNETDIATLEREALQKQIAKDANIMFSVGPLLDEYANRFKDRQDVIKIIPGLPYIKKCPYRDKAFNVIMFGRMDDEIKNIEAGAKAFGKAAGELKKLNITSHLTIFGLPSNEEEYDKAKTEIKNLVNKEAERMDININALPYLHERTQLFDKLCENHACLLLAWHEGFGLVGWEAIASSVPLILSKNSGLYEFLEKKHLISYVYPVDIKNTDEDVESIQNKLKIIEHDSKKALENAKELKEKLLAEGYTWERTVREFAEACNVEVNPPEQLDKNNIEENEGYKNSDKQIKISKYDKTFSEYKALMVQEHKHLPTSGFKTKVTYPIAIENVYVNMRAFIKYKDFKYTPDEKEKWFENRDRDKLTGLDIKEAIGYLNKHNLKTMVILGDPGSGKTTLLKYITVMLIEGDPESKLGLNREIIPFFIPLKELKNSDTETFEDFISRICNFEGYGITKNDFAGLLKKEKKGLILLDGLDEVADRETRIKVIKWINKARKNYIDTIFIITSRLAGYYGDAVITWNCIELTIDDFSEEEIKTFLRNWFTSVEESAPKEIKENCMENGLDKANKFINKLDNYDEKSMYRFLKNPLLCQIAAIIYYFEENKLPERRVDLFQECITVLLSEWRKDSDIKLSISEPQAENILSPIALFLHKVDNRKQAPLKEILPIIQKSFNKLSTDISPAELLKQIRDISGLFIGHSEEEYGFIHLNFQEYLAALEIAKTRQTGILVENYLNSWWREVILLFCSLNEELTINDFIRSLIRDDSFLNEISLLDEAIKDSAAKPIDVLEDALYDKDVKIKAKNNCIRLLKNIGTTRSLEIIEKARTSGILELKESADELSGKTEVKTIIHEKDKSEMVLVPAGQFIYGSKEDDKDADSNEKPQRIIELDAFYIDKYPVTNEKYCMFLNVVKPGKEKLDKWIYLDGKYEKEKCRIIKKGNDYIIEEGYNNYPVIFVTWHGAKAYADWAGKKLPTEEQWEKAARGTEGLIYPWGNEFKPGLCNSKESGEEKTTPVGNYPDGKSVYGCMDMAGNVWEWTESFYDKDKKSYAVRGGSRYNDRQRCRCAVRGSGIPAGGNSRLGFRCARN